MSVLSAFGYLVAVKGLVVPGNAARTARNIAGHEGLFRFGILSLYLVAALDVVVAWALYRVFKPVSEGVCRSSRRGSGSRTPRSSSSPSASSSERSACPPRRSSTSTPSPISGTLGSSFSV